MRFPLKTLALSALAALALGGAAQAADVHVTGGYPAEGWRRASDYGGSYGGYRGHGGHGRHGYDDDGYRGWHGRRWGHVGGRGGWDRGDCRVIVKRRVSPWGDVSVKRVQICE